ncbi:MAG: hypothetical protein JO031_11005 [Ktedonobacteraceae bacterium]|nr:hypothetical protein [Ktedonobacteraceae bacterium]
MFLRVLVLADGDNSLFWTHLGQLFDWLEALLIRSTSVSRPVPFYPIFILLSVRRDMTLFVKIALTGHKIIADQPSRSSRPLL